MAAQQNPKKPKSKKVDLNVKANWRSILKQVDKKEVPIHVLEKILVRLKDGTDVAINVKDLLLSGQDPDILEEHIQARLTELDHYVDNIEFFVDLDSVVSVIQPETDRILSKL